MFDYSTNWQARNDLIWKGMTAVYSPSVKDPIKYVNRMKKKFGEILKEVVGRAYETKDQFCYAVTIDRIDEMLCEKYGWKTIQEYRKD